MAIDSIARALSGQANKVATDAIAAAEEAIHTATDQIPSIVTDWLDDNVTPVGSVVVVDSSLSISGAAADAKATGDGLTDLKKAIGVLPVASSSNVHAGYINGTTNLWASIGGSLRYSIIPVDGGKSIFVDATGLEGDTSVAALTAYSAPTTGDSPSFSSATGWTALNVITKNTTYTGTLPADAKYLYVYCGSSLLNRVPVSLKIGDYDYVSGAVQNIENAFDYINEENDDNFRLYYEDCTTIANGTNYNSITAVGNYRCASSSSAQSMTNCPTINAHRLVVMDTTANKRKMQLIIDNARTYYTRFMLTDDVWDSKWEQISTFSELLTLGDLPITDSYYIHQGFINASTGKWASIGGTIRYAIIPVSGGESVYLSAIGLDGDTSIAALTSYSNPATGDNAAFSSATGWTSLNVVSNTSTFEGIVPSDANYLYIYGGNTQLSRIPTSLMINGYEYRDNVTKNIQRLAQSIESTAVPGYYFANNYLPNKVSQINTLAMGLTYTDFQSVFFTDYHIEDNMGNSPALIEYIVKKTGIQNVVFGGDAIQHDYDSKLGGYNLLCRFLEKVNPINEVANFYLITGNHEMNDPGNSHPETRLDRGVIYNLFNKPRYYKITPVNSSITNSFYIDDYTSKFRIYGIDCDWKSAMSFQESRAVSQSFLTVPEGFTVIIFSHAGVNYVNNSGTYSVTGLYAPFEGIMQCAAALNDGTSTTVTIFGSSYTCDYTGKSRPVIGAFLGHMHFDAYWIYDSRFPVIVTTSDMLGSLNQSVRTAGTINEQAFDVIQIDTTAKRIYMTRIGYGNDRVFAYGTGAGPVT